MFKSMAYDVNFLSYDRKYNNEILCPKIVLDSASTRYSLQTKLDRQYALIFILQQAMYLCEVLCKNYS